MLFLLLGKNRLPLDTLTTLLLDAMEMEELREKASIVAEKVKKGCKKMKKKKKRKKGFVWERNGLRCANLANQLCFLQLAKKLFGLRYEFG